MSEGIFFADSKVDSAHKAGKVKFKIPKGSEVGKKWVLDVTWNNSSGKKLSHNDYMFGIEKKQAGEFRHDPMYPEYPPAG